MTLIIILIDLFYNKYSLTTLGSQKKDNLSMSVSSKPLFRADHVGSLLRPKAITDGFKKFNNKEISNETFLEIQDSAIKDVIKLQENIGLQSITDGEFRRASYWSTFVERVQGLEVAESRFSFYDDHGHEQQFTAPIVTEKLSRPNSVAGDEFNFVKENTTQTPKTTIVSPPTMHMWRLDETLANDCYESREKYFSELANIFREEIQSLYELGSTYIQLDDVPIPMMSDPKILDIIRNDGINPDVLLNDYIKLFNDCIDERPKELKIAVHMCRGNYKGKFLSEGGYETLAEKIFNELNVDTFFLEYDSPRSGDFEPLKHVPKNKSVILGIVSSKTSQIESKDKLKTRIDEASQYIDINQLGLSPQCGFASTVAGNPVTLDVEKSKLALIVEVANEVWGSK